MEEYNSLSQELSGYLKSSQDLNSKFGVVFEDLVDNIGVLEDSDSEGLLNIVEKRTKLSEKFLENILTIQIKSKYLKRIIREE